MSPDTKIVLEAMVQLEQARTCAKAANKLALDAEKEKDAAEEAVEELIRSTQRENALMMMLVMLMICSQNWTIVTSATTAGRERASNTVAMCNSGLATMYRSLAQARTVSSITRVWV